MKQPTLQKRARDRGLISLLLFLMTFTGDFAIAGSDTSDEYAVKAAMIFNLPGFTHWPERALSESSGTLDLCVVTNDRVRGILAGLDGRAVGKRRFRIRTVDTEMKFAGCDLLFVSRTEQHKLSHIFRGVEGQPILTIGETDEFVETGGMISLITMAQKVKLKVNLNAVRQAGMRLNSRLLRLATIVKNRNE
ncbi:MAG: YfiR family protein [Chromatiales bacterium]|nr:YfiR family protein [Gammaproteobacteria bacterium]